jgi:hypothetical protein
VNNGDYALSIMAVDKGFIMPYNFAHAWIFEIFDSRQNVKWFGDIGSSMPPKLDWAV